MLTAAEERRHREAWQRFDRVTALGCAQRGVPYDPELSKRRWKEYVRLRGWTPDPHYGDGRDTIDWETP